MATKLFSMPLKQLEPLWPNSKALVTIQLTLEHYEQFVLAARASNRTVAEWIEHSCLNAIEE